MYPGIGNELWEPVYVYEISRYSILFILAVSNQATEEDVIQLSLPGYGVLIMYTHCKCQL